MRNTLCATALVAVALLGAGCKKGPDLVGKWTAQMNGQTADFEFKADNTMAISAKQGPASIVFSGDYKRDGENVTLTLKDVKLQGVPEAQQSMAKSLFSAVLNKPQTSKIAFTNDDEIAFTSDKAGATAKGAASMSPAGGSFTLKRVKE